MREHFPVTGAPSGGRSPSFRKRFSLPDSIQQRHAKRRNRGNDLGQLWRPCSGRMVINPVTPRPLEFGSDEVFREGSLPVAIPALDEAVRIAASECLMDGVEENVSVEAIPAGQDPKVIVIAHAGVIPAEFGHDGQLLGNNGLPWIGMDTEGWKSRQQRGIPEHIRSRA